MGIEFELKFRATPAIQREIEAALDAPAVCYDMQTTYYDTPAGALSKRFYTLRRRMENNRSVCTLKTPADGQGRKEFEVQCDNIQVALEELCKLSQISELPALFAQGIVPVCGAKFQRRAITLETNGCTVELALDTGVLIGADRKLPLCEIEVELKSGSQQAAVTYATLLAARYGLEREPLSKFRRAFLLTGGK